MVARKLSLTSAITLEAWVILALAATTRAEEAIQRVRLPIPQNTLRILRLRLMRTATLRYPK